MAAQNVVIVFTYTNRSNAECGSTLLISIPAFRTFDQAGPLIPSLHLLSRSQNDRYGSIYLAAVPQSDCRHCVRPQPRLGPCPGSCRSADDSYAGAIENHPKRNNAPA